MCNGRLAQLVQSICLTSRGSAVRIRQRPQKHKTYIPRYVYGRLAQLVQSICLTSRGSAVRIRQRPQNDESMQFDCFGSFFYRLFHNSEKNIYFCTLIIIILYTTYET